MRDSSSRALPPRWRATTTISATRAGLAAACCLALGALVMLPGVLAPPPAPLPATHAARVALPTAARATARTDAPWTPPPGAAAAAHIPAEPVPAPVGDTAPSPSVAPRSRPPEQLTGYGWPVRNARITTWFEHTEGGFVVLDVGRVHDGIDLATFCGDWILAAHDGVVVYSGREFDAHIGYNGRLDAFYGEMKRRKLTLDALPIVVVVDDGNGYRSVYVHLRESFVKAGQAVKAGQRIGREGATGHASGCHLHYSLIRMDGPFQAVAPELVEKWHYPRLLRERVDPMRVLSLEQDGAGTIVSGGDPPARSPRYGSEETVPHPRPTPRPDRPDVPVPSAPGTSPAVGSPVPGPGRPAASPTDALSGR